jgi:hypothetical protein
MVRARRSPTPDGRANNGGARQGTPGQNYSNRSDMRTQKIAVPPSAEYGQGAQLRRAQQAVPMAGAPPTPPAGGAPQPGPAAFATPEDTPNLTDPTNRPDEPLTHGLSFGPGAGPEALGPPAPSDVEARLRALYMRFPTQELRELIRQQDLGA